MKNIFKNKFGFTLLEIMVSLGIVSVIAIVIMDSQKSAIKSVGQVERSTAVNNLLQMVNSQMGRNDVCLVNFQGKPIAGGTLADLRGMGGAVILTSPSEFEKDQINITAMSYAQVAATKAIELAISYTWKKDRITAGQVGNVSSVYRLKINVGTDLAGNIQSCNSDSAEMLKNAVENACKGNRASWTPANATYPYGHCEHEIEIYSNTTSAIVTPPLPTSTSYFCPANHFLRQISTNGGKTRFECQTAKTNGPACIGWQYLVGVSATGAAVCKDVRNLIAGGSGILMTTAGAMVANDLNCPAGKVLIRVDGATGNEVCVDPIATVSCPADTYFQSFNASGNPVCTAYKESNICGSPSFMTSVDSIGNVTCGNPTIPAACGAGSVMTGVDVNGVSTGCVANGL